MRGEDHQQTAMFSYLSPEQRVPANHPLRKLRPLVDTVLTRLSPAFTAMYARIGRPSIAPEKLLRALLLQFLYTIRSERLLMEELDYNLLFRWFVGLNADDPVWDATVYAKNRERLLKHEVAEAFFQQVAQLAGEHDLLSDEHFTVDGTLVEAWAGIKSFKKKEDSTPPPAPPSDPPGDPGNPEVNFRGEKRSNKTHQSTTDPEARLYKKSQGKEAKLGYLGHIVAENRNGLVINSEVTLATGTAEREAALAMMEEREGQKRVTLGADKNYDVHDFVQKLRGQKVTPHVAQNNARRSSAIDARTTRHPGYAVSQRKRKRVEEVFGWLKTVALMRKVRHRGRQLVEWMFTMAAAAYNLVRIRNLVGAEG
jgi:transposase